VWREEWNKDFQYMYATDPLAAEVRREGGREGGIEGGRVRCGAVERV